MKKINFTCADYRKEMMLVQLQRKYSHANLDSEEKQTLKKEIEALERDLGLR